MRTVAIYYLLAVAVIAGLVGMALSPASSALGTIWFMETTFSMGGLLVVIGFDAESPWLAWTLVIIGMLFVLVGVYRVAS